MCPISHATQEEGSRGKTNSLGTSRYKFKDWNCWIAKCRVVFYSNKTMCSFCGFLNINFYIK